MSFGKNQSMLNFVNYYMDTSQNIMYLIWSLKQISLPTKQVVIVFHEKKLNKGQKLHIVGL